MVVLHNKIYDYNIIPMNKIEIAIVYTDLDKAEVFADSLGRECRLNHHSNEDPGDEDEYFRVERDIETGGGNR